MLPKRYRRLIARRFRRRPLLGPLLAATVALNAAVWATDRGDSRWVAGFFAGQFALLGAWLAWSPSGVPTRLIATLGLSALLSAIATDYSRDPYATIHTFAVLALLASAVSCSMTRWGLSMLVNQRHGARIPARSLRQFSISLLLAMTTALAVAVTASRWVDWGVALDEWTLVAVGIESLVPAVAIGAFGLSSPRWRTLALTTTTATVVIAYALVMAPPSNASYFMPYMGALWLTCVVWLLGLGVRPRRQPKKSVVLRLAARDAEHPADDSARRSEAPRTLFIALGFDARV